jgi:hypothetical protein
MDCFCGCHGVDDYLLVGPRSEVVSNKEKMMDRFECDEVGELREYIGCKVDCDDHKGRLKFTQPVLLQSYVDEFDLPEGQFPTTPAVPGSVLVPVEEINQLSRVEQTKSRQAATLDEMVKAGYSKRGSGAI